MRALLGYYYKRGKTEVDRREGRGGKGRGRDLPDQCQTASYAPVISAEALQDHVTIHGVKTHQEKKYKKPSK